MSDNPDAVIIGKAMSGGFYIVYARQRFAVDEAYAAGYVGKNILGTDFSVDIVLHTGAGAYVVGEETALIESIEGKRGQPRLKPPFPAVVGFLDCPTVVNNVVTLCAVPWIVRHGGAAYAAMGVGQSTGTMPFQLAGNVTADGLSHGLFLQLTEWLRETPYRDRLMSAEDLIAKMPGMIVNGTGVQAQGE